MYAALPLIAQGVGGLAQIFGSNTKKYQKKLEELTNQSPLYSGGGGVMDYYNKALQNYTPNPYSSRMYNKSINDIQRGTATGLSALNDRRSALAGVGKLVAIQDDATQKAAINAEQEQQRRLSQVGTAAGMKTNEEHYRYTTNQLNPYLRRVQLAQQQAGGAAATKQAGFSNVFNTLTNAAFLLNGNKKDDKKETSNLLTEYNKGVYPKQESPTLGSLIDNKNNDGEDMGEYYFNPITKKLERRLKK